MKRVLRAIGAFVGVWFIGWPAMQILGRWDFWNGPAPASDSLPFVAIASVGVSYAVWQKSRP